jgi:hypothetical protein
MCQSLGPAFLTQINNTPDKWLPAYAGMADRRRFQRIARQTMQITPPK